MASFSDHFCVCICIPRKRDFGDPYKGNQWFCLLECGPKYDIIESTTKSKNSVKKKHHNCVCAGSGMCLRILTRIKSQRQQTVSRGWFCGTHSNLFIIASIFHQIYFVKDGFRKKRRRNHSFLKVLGTLAPGVDRLLIGAPLATIGNRTWLAQSDVTSQSDDASRWLEQSSSCAYLHCA